MAALLKLMASLLLALSGAGVFEWGIRAIRNRDRAVGPFVGSKTEIGARRFVKIWMVLTLSAGASMVAAAVLIWINPRAATLFGLWPAAAMTLA